MMKKAIILNYATGDVVLAYIPSSMETSEQIEDYLLAIGYKISQISYMISDTGSFGVFFHGQDTTCTIL